ncbi:MAG: hypothetical protein KatS3mg102_0432 [Planctomycetota bacterium]|nr:MAG: hypothetical protein KatS3mg102_0432 [Planctomycetota bacterium]
MIPGMGRMLKDMPLDDKEINRLEAMILSMTPEERRDDTLINQSRRMRIARGSGLSPTEVASMLKQFRQVQDMMKQMGKLPGLRQMFGRGRKEFEQQIAAQAAAARAKKKRRKPF